MKILSGDYKTSVVKITSYNKAPYKKIHVTLKSHEIKKQKCVLIILSKRSRKQG